MERAWASRPSASASAMASGPSVGDGDRRTGQQRRALEEIEHRQAGGKARRARGRQHMVGPGDVIAHRLGRVTAEEDGAGMAHARQQRLGIGDGEFEMFGRKAIRQGGGLFERFDHDDGAIVAPAGSGDLLARQDRQARAPPHRPPCRRTPASSVMRMDCEEASCSAWREQIGGDPVRIIGAVGDDENFRRPGDGIDADLAEHLALGRGDIGIAGADDLVDRRRWSRCHRPARPRPGPRRRDRSR